MKRVCSKPGCTNLTDKTRCSKHGRSPYDTKHKLLSMEIRNEWVRRNGWLCPGWGDTRAHDATDLVADHNTAGDPSKGYTVRCRSCNSKRAHATG